MSKMVLVGLGVKGLMLKVMKYKSNLSNNTSGKYHNPVFIFVFTSSPALNS